MASKIYLGLDLTSGAQKPSACVSIDDNLQILNAVFLSGDTELISFITGHKPDIVALDAPLSLPEGLCCLDENCPCKPVNEYKGRLSERMLAKMGIPCYFTTKKSIIKNMVIRAIGLRNELEKGGFQVIEVYPYASKRQLFGQLKRKTTAEGIKQLRKALGNLLEDSDGLIDNWNHDLCDASIAAYTGLLYIRGEVIKLGNNSEGFIYLPGNSCGQGING